MTTSIRVGAFQPAWVCRRVHLDVCLSVPATPTVTPLAPLPSARTASRSVPRHGFGAIGYEDDPASGNPPVPADTSEWQRRSSFERRQGDSPLDLAALGRVGNSGRFEPLTCRELLPQPALRSPNAACQSPRGFQCGDVGDLHAPRIVEQTARKFCCAMAALTTTRCEPAEGAKRDHATRIATAAGTLNAETTRGAAVTMTANTTATIAKASAA